MSLLLYPAGRQRGTPYVDLRSQEGALGLTLLHKALLDEEQQQQQAQQQQRTQGRV